MSNLKKIREKFGLSQQQAAHWLGISRSLAEHYERGIRSLPTHALLQLAKLEMIVLEFENDSLKKKQVAEENSLGEMKNGNTNHGNNNDFEKNASQSAGVYDTAVPQHPMLTFQRDKLERLQQQLSVLKSRHTILQQQMMLIQKMVDNCNEQTCIKEKLWLQMLYHGLCSKLSKFDETKQLPLEAKIMEIKIKQGF